MNDRQVQELLKAKRKEIHEEAVENIEEHTPAVADLELCDVVRGLSDACEDFSHDLLFSISCDSLKINPLQFRVRLPDPAFFFIEHGSPFVLSLLGEVSYGRGKKYTRYQSYLYQLRTCCASLREPKLNIEDLQRLPQWVVLLLFKHITEAIAPPYAVALMRCFYRKAQEESGKNQLLDIYMMSKNGDRPTSWYLVPSVKNPYIVAAVEYIVFEIGAEYEREMMRLQMKAASLSPLKMF